MRANDTADADATSLDAKLAWIRERFADVSFAATGERRVARSASTEHRSRCRFHVLRDANGALTYATWTNGAPRAVGDDFPCAIGAIRAVMGATLRACERSAVLGGGLEAAHFLASAESGRVLVTLVYSTPIDEAWLVEARRVLANDRELVSVELIGRSKGVALRTAGDSVVEEYALRDGTRLRYRHREGAFSNPNRSITIATMDFLRECAQLIGDVGAGSNLLELYCGNANHTCALAPMFKRVVAIEINPDLVEAARESLEMNNVSNVEVVLADSQKFSKRMLAGKFQDASGNRILLDDFSVVLVDPPRAGLDPDTLALVSRVDHILYVSCGPDNLLKNIREGLRSHVVEQLIVLDHFPNTRHVEVAVYMRRCP